MRSVHSESSHEGFTLSVLARRTYPKSPREGADPSVLSAIFDEITKRTYANSNCSKFNPFVLALHLLASSLFHSVKRQTVQIRLRTHVRHRGLMPFGLRLLLSSLEVMPLQPPSAMSAVGATQDSKRVGRQLAGGSTHSYLFCSRLPCAKQGTDLTLEKPRTNGTIRRARA